MNNSKEELEIEKNSTSLEKIQFSDILDNKLEDNYLNINYLTKKPNKSRNIKKNNKSKKDQDKKNETDINDKKNKKINIFIFRTSENKPKSNLISILSDDITIVTKKYISSSYDKIKKRKILNEEIIPLKPRELRKKSFDFSPMINIKEKNTKKIFSNKKISTMEINGNTEIISTTKIRKISENSDNNSENNEINKEKKFTNINFVLNLDVKNNIKNLVDKVIPMLNEEKNDENNNNLCEKNDIGLYQQENKFKKFQLDSIEEVYEEENDSKTKSRNNTDRSYDANSNCNNYDNINKYNITFSNEKEIKSNNINSTGISTKFGTGTGRSNNIFDISSGEEENYERNGDINYIENNNIENDNDNGNRTNIDIEHDTEHNYLLKPIRPNDNDNSISFMNESDINKLLYYSPSKVELNLIEHNNYENNFIKDTEKLNNSAINKRNDIFDEFSINIPRITNGFKLNDISCDNFNDINRTYKKKKIIKPKSYSPCILNNLISPKNLSKPENKIKEIKLSLNKCLKIFCNNNQKIKKLNKELFEFNNTNINNINLLKERDYTKIFEMPSSNIKKILINLDMNIDEIDYLRINKNIKNSNSNKSTIMTTLDKCQNELLSKSKNYIKDKKCKINQFNLLETQEEKNHKSRNKIDQNNSLFYKKSSLLNLSSGFNSYQTKQENSKENNAITKCNIKNENNNEELNLINNIHVCSDEIQNKKNNNYLSFFKSTYSENKLYISIQSYEEFIKNIITQTQKLKTELLKDNNNKSKINMQNITIYSELDELIIELEKKIKILKYNYLCILTQKHYSKTNEEKIKVIKDGNIINKREIFFIFFQNMLNQLKEKLILENKETKENYINKIFKILNNNKTINKFDIKFSKKIYKEENKISPEIINERFIIYNKADNTQENNIYALNENKGSNSFINKKFVVATSVIIPILFGISYLINFYNNSNN